MPIPIVQKLEKHTGIMNVNFKRAQIVYDLLSPRAWKCNTHVQLQIVEDSCRNTRLIHTALSL